MMVGSERLLDDVLAGYAWGLDQDLGYRWRLTTGDGGRRTLSLHLRVADDDAAGLLYAREVGAGPDRCGVLVAGRVHAAEVEPVVAACLGEDGGGDLDALHRLLTSLATSTAT